MRRSRSLALALTAAFAVCGWIGSASGSLAFAAITERDHLLAVSLGDGHLDLVREHAGPTPGGDVTQPIDPDHVVHLCHSLDAASSRPQATGSPADDAQLVAAVRTLLPAISRHPISPPACRHREPGAPSTTVWLL